MNHKEQHSRAEFGETWWGRGLIALYVIIILGSFFLSLNSSCRGANTGDCTGPNAFYCRKVLADTWNCEISDFFNAFLVAIGVAIVLILVFKLISWIVQSPNSSKE